MLVPFATDVRKLSSKYDTIRNHNLSTSLLEPVVVTFLEGQFVRVYVGRQLTEVEDIEAKFRTRKPSGMLLSTSSNNAPDRVELKLSNGQLEYQINFGQKLHVSILKMRQKCIKINESSFRLSFGEWV